MRTLCVIALTLAALAAQDTPPAPAPKPVNRVEGKVVNLANGQGVRKASVTLISRNGRNTNSYAVTCDDNGAFQIEDVDPGEYNVTVDRQGFMTKPPGASGAPLPPVKVEKGQPVPPISIPMVALGVITGRVTDEDGDPVRNASVHALQYVYNAGKRQLRDVASQVSTNDKGDFRLYGLRPGTFYIQASARDNPSFGQPNETIRGPKPATHAPTFYPSTTDSVHAVPVEISSGTLLRGIDVRMRRDVMYTIRGKFPPSENQRPNMGNYIVQLVRREGGGMGNFGGPSRTNDAFEFSTVASGSYVVLGSRVEPDHRLYAYQPVEVGSEDVDMGVLVFSPGSDMSGTVQFEGTNKPQTANLRISLQADTPSMFGFPSSELKPDGTFVMHDVAPGIYRVNAPSPGAYLKTVRLGEQESADGRVDVTHGVSHLSVVLATDVAQVEGSVKQGDGSPSVRARVTLVPEGGRIGRQDLSRFAFSDEKGEFKVINVPPGEYKVFAWEDVQQGAPQDPEFRKPFEKRGVVLKIEPGGKAKTELTVISTADMEHPEQ